MAFLFKSIFPKGKTAAISPPPEVRADLNLVPTQFSSPRVSDAAPSSEPVANEAAVLQDFLIKNFLLDEPPAAAATPESLPAYAHIPDPLPELSSNSDAKPVAGADTDASANAEADASAEGKVDASADASPIALTLAANCPVTEINAITL